MFPSIRIIRPLNTGFTVLIAFGFCFAVNKNLPIPIMFLTGLCAGLTAAAGNIINDIVDVNIDIINKPKRVLPSSQMTIKSAFTFYYLLVSIAIFMSLQISLASFLIVLSANLLLMLYSLRFKRIVGFKNIVVAVLAAMVFLFAGEVSGNIRLSIFPAIFAFLSTLLREIIKDTEDSIGDAKSGIPTIPILFGIIVTNKILRIISLSLIISCCLAYFLGLLSINFFIPALFLVFPSIIFLNIKLGKTSIHKSTLKLSVLAKIIMVLGFISILVGLW